MTYEQELIGQVIAFLEAHDAMEDARKYLAKASVVLETAKDLVKIKEDVLRKCVGQNVQRRNFIVGGKLVRVIYENCVPPKVVVEDVIM